MRKFLDTLGSAKMRLFPGSETSAAKAARPLSRLRRFEQLEQRTLLSITSEGLTALNIDLADSLDDVFGRFPEIRGSGIRVGVIADGYSPTSELPSVTASSPGSGSQGTAVLEIIHDVAPEASLLFAPANSEGDFAAAVNHLLSGRDGGYGIDLAIAATDADKLEGHGGTTPFTFTVTRTGDLGGTTTVDWQFAHGTTDDDDFGGTAPAGGTLTFDPGVTTQTITVYASGDTDFEYFIDETFTISLANPSSPAAIDPGAATASGTIRNDDADLTIGIWVSTFDDIDDGDYSPGNLSIREALALAKLMPGPDTIMFDPLLIADPLADPTITLGGTELAIDSDVNIQGLPGLTIDAGGLSRAFRVGGRANATISDLAITGGYSGSIGGALWVQNADLTLLSVNITASTAEYGGAIFAYHNATVTLDAGTTLSGNTAEVRGGAVYMYGATSVVNVLDARFTDNHAASHGGALAAHNGAVLTVLGNSQLSANTAGGHGGAVYMYGAGTQLNMSGGTITGNQAGSRGGGVAVYNGTLLALADNTDIVNNTAAVDAGSNVYVSGGTFMGSPIIVSTLDDNGDGDYSPGNLSLREAIFLASTYSGPDRIEFDSALFADPQADPTITLGGTELVINSDVEITGPVESTLIIDAAGLSRAFRVGGGANVTISDLAITGGYSDSIGGALWVQNADLTLLSVNITDSTAPCGGAIFAYHNATLTLDAGTTLSGNTAAVRGGAVYMYGATSVVNVLDASITDNQAASHGGAVAAHNGAVLTVLGNSQLSANTAGGHGGAVYMYGAGTQLNMSGGTITGNQAGSRGGGVAVGNGAVLNLDAEGSVSDNSAPRDPDIYLGSGGSLNSRAADAIFASGELAALDYLYSAW